MKNNKIVILGGDNDSTYIMYNYLKDKYNIIHVIIDNKVSRKDFLKKRIKKLGLIKVIGQVAFSLFICPLLRREGKSRIELIYKNNKLDISPIPSSKITVGFSVNSIDVQNLLKKLNPAVIIVNGTRIISKETLSCVNCRFINTHMGITPKYRGVHGAYWALVNQDLKNVGVTVHFVDEGIDTGEVIAQARILVTDKDNFFTYPTLQIVEGIKLMDKTLQEYFMGTLTLSKGTKESAIWSHPTFFDYIKNRIYRRVK